MGKRRNKLLLAGGWVLANAAPVFAQDGSSMNGFGDVLISVSALLVAVSFLFVMLKLARLIDVFTERIENTSSDKSE